MPNAVNNIIQGYLNNVKRRLQHLPEDERVAIVDSLQSHIHEALASRCPNTDPTADDVNAVLAEMDPPEAFGAESRNDALFSNRRRRLSKVALITFVTVLTGLLLSANLGPPRQREEWSVSRFVAEVEKGRVSNGELSESRFVGQTKTGRKFVVSLPEGEMNYWMNLLQRRHVSVRFESAGFADIIGPLVLSFILPVVIWGGLLFLALLIAVLVIRGYAGG